MGQLTAKAGGARQHCHQPSEIAEAVGARGVPARSGITHGPKTAFVVPHHAVQLSGEYS